MKFFSLFFINLFLTGLNAKSQDGSDMRYINIEDVDTSYIEKTIHIDFYNRSFASKKIDTITIMVNNKSVLFIEHREDAGFNNWFNRQYLESVERVGTEKLRIEMSVIKRVTKDSIFVTNYFNFYKPNGQPAHDGAFTHDYSFAKMNISEILLKSSRK
jgi:hypothetical protein